LAAGRPIGRTVAAAKHTCMRPGQTRQASYLERRLRCRGAASWLITRTPK